MWIIQRDDGKYVTEPGSEHSYTKDIRKAWKLRTLSEAERNLCPENEIILPLLEAVNQ